MNENKKAVFLSYARQDAEAASRICEALRAAGIEVWFDQSELRGGDAWDASIRRQIKTCTLVIPIISANTQHRTEGYFRLEWKLAIDRSHYMPPHHPFLVPVAIDDTDANDDLVPEKFRDVQWTQLPGGVATPQFVARVAALLQGSAPPAGATSHPGKESTQQGRMPADNVLAPPPQAGEMQTPGVPAASPGKKIAVALTAIGMLVCAGIAFWAMRGREATPAAVVPYSSEDRRMTFAVLPFQSPAQDSRGAQVATATGNQLLAVLEGRRELVSVVSRGSVDEALAHEANLGKLAKLLNVHFLVRGTVSRDGKDYKAAVLTIDGDSERVLSTSSLTVPETSLTPLWLDDVQEVSADVTNAGLVAEVKRARNKPLDQMDVRDLSFRAIEDWWDARTTDGRKANVEANALLNKALALAPDDLFALRAVANINLCDCVNIWSSNPDEQRAVGAAAMEKYLRADPNSMSMLGQKSNLFQLRLRWEDSLAIADRMLELEPTDSWALMLKSVAYLRLQRVKEARAIVDEVLARYPNHWIALTIAANVAFAQGDYARAADLGQRATAQMEPNDLRDRVSGPVQLTVIAGETRLGHTAKAKAAYDDFTTLQPQLTSITAIRKWMHPSAELADFQPLFEALKQSGIPD